MNKTLEEQLKLSLKIPKEQFSQTREKINDNQSLAIVSVQYHDYIKKIAKKKKISVSHYIEKAVIRALAKDEAFDE